MFYIALFLFLNTKLDVKAFLLPLLNKLEARSLTESCDFKTSCRLFWSEIMIVISIRRARSASSILKSRV